MALVLKDRVRETTTTTGTGNYVLAGAVTGYESFAGIGDGNTTYYACTNGTDWEVGIGTYTASGTILARTTILESSNADSAVSWAAGSKTIFVTQPSEKAVYLDASGNSNIASSNLTDGSSLLKNVVEDTTPQLGGNLDTNGNNINFGDDDKAIFGSALDGIQIYNTAAGDKFISEAGGGNLKVQGDNLYLQNSAGTENYIIAISNAAVTLHYDSAAKLATTATGIDVTGTITTDEVTVDGTGTSNFTSTATSPVQINGTSIPTLTVRNSTTPVETQIRATTTEGLVRTATNHPLVFATNASEAARIDSSGNLLVSKTSANSTTDGIELRGGSGAVRFIGKTDSNAVGYLNRGVSDGDILQFAKDNSTVGSIGNSSGRLYIGSPDGSTSYIRFNSNEVVPSTSSGGARDNIINLGAGAARWKDLYLSGNANVGDLIGPTSANFDIRTGAGTGDMIFYTNGSESVRIDSSGRMLVGKTTTTESDSGLELRGEGLLKVNRDNGVVMSLRRDTGAGHLVELKKDASDIGFFGASSNTKLYVSGPNAGGILFDQYGATNGAPLPCTSTGAKADNLHDFGVSDARWDDIYATNGTIQTSDQNEKQQIASLTDAEIAAAKAISQLFKTFKWNDKVAAKGDAARRHTGVVAQDVEAAMTAAGLDAGDYAFFISTTWWEADGETYYNADDAPEGATEHNRKGIRYPELLSFVGAATEQRLANIETRLAALEAN